MKEFIFSMQTAVGIAALCFFLLPLIIIKDSRKRMGSPSWGWALLSFFLFVAAYTNFPTKTTTHISTWTPSGTLYTPLQLPNILLMYAAVVIPFVGIFILYRFFTRKAAKRYATRQQVENKDANASGI